MGIGWAEQLSETVRNLRRLPVQGLSASLSLAEASNMRKRKTLSWTCCNWCAGCSCCCVMCAAGAKLSTTDNRCFALSYPTRSSGAWRNSEGCTIWTSCRLHYTFWTLICLSAWTIFFEPLTSLHCRHAYVLWFWNRI